MSVTVSKKQMSGRSWILVALMFTMMLAAMDATIVSTAIPQIVGDLGGFALFGWVFSIYLLAQTITIPIYGKMADIYGRKPVLLFGMVVFLLGSTLSAASWNMLSLIIFRAVQGLGAGAMVATINTIAGDIYSIEERGKIQGWLSSVWGISAIVGPTLGGAFADYASWRWVFLINLPIGAIALTLISVFFKENVEKHDRKVDYKGALMMLISGTVLIFTLMEGGTLWNWFSWQGIVMILISLVLVLLTVIIERRSPEPIMPGWIWKSKLISGANLAMMGMGAIMLGPSMYLPVFGQSFLGMGAIAAGLLLASSSIGWPLASSLSPRVYLKIGFKNTAVIGAIVVVMASAVFIYLPYNAPIWYYVAAQVLLGAGFGFLSTPALVGVQSVVKWKKRGVVTGANMFSRYLGQSIGAAVLGGVFNTHIKHFLDKAPVQLKADLPQKVDDVIEALKSSRTSASVLDYLKEAFYFSTHQVYLIMTIIGVLVILILQLQPRKFPLVDD